MTPEQLQLFLGLVSRHANIPPSLAQGVAKHVREQAATVERLRVALKKYGKHTTSCNLDEPCSCGLDALSTPTAGSAG